MKMLRVFLPLMALLLLLPLGAGVSTASNNTVGVAAKRPSSTPVPLSDMGQQRSCGIGGECTLWATYHNPNSFAIKNITYEVHYYDRYGEVSQVRAFKFTKKKKVKAKGHFEIKVDYWSMQAEGGIIVRNVKAYSAKK